MVVAKKKTNKKKTGLRASSSSKKISKKIKKPVKKSFKTKVVRQEPSKKCSYSRLATVFAIINAVLLVPNVFLFFIARLSVASRIVFILLSIINFISVFFIYMGYVKLKLSKFVSHIVPFIIGTYFLFFVEVMLLLYVRTTFVTVTLPIILFILYGGLLILFSKVLLLTKDLFLRGLGVYYLILGILSILGVAFNRIVLVGLLLLFHPIFLMSIRVLEAIYFSSKKK